MRLKATARNWAKASPVIGRALRFATGFRPKGIVILMYHSVLDDPNENAFSIGVNNTHSTAVFRRQMEIISRYYDPVTIQDVLLMLTGDRPMLRKPVAVSFDDGYADNAEIAAPVLKEVGFPGSFYLTVDAVESGTSPWFCHLRHAFSTTKKTGWLDPAGHSRPLLDATERELAILIASECLARLPGHAQHEALGTIERDLDTEPLSPGRRLMMTWEQARGLSMDGHLVGSHSLTHPNLAHIGPHELRRELMESRLRIETNLSIPIHHFSYPAAALAISWTQRTVTSTREAGYRTAVTTTPGYVGAGDDPLCLRRVCPPLNLDEFVWSLECTFLGLYN